MNSRTIDILKKLKQEIPPDTLISAVKVGQQQIIEIARALMFDARLIIMDEPTSALSDKEVEVLFEIIMGLRSNGKAIAYISHKLEELTGISDQYIILRDGVLVDSGEMAGMSHEDIIQKMVGRGIRQAGRTSESSSEEVCLKVENISLSHSELPGAYLVHPISFSLFKGEILGVFGLMGAGRTELLETIFGLHPGRSSGEISINGKPCSFRSPSDAIRAGIGLVPEDRKNDGLVPGMDIKMNISLSSIENIEVNGILSAKEERKLSRKYIEELGIKTPSGDLKAGNLSGGNQQKTILAKWLATQPSILLLDEPTRGIDINAKNEIYKLILKLCSEGMGIVMVSSELPEILAISNRILVLSEGRLSGEFKAGEVSEEQIMKAAIPRSIKSVV